MPVIVDTNILLVANGEAQPQANRTCVLKCQQFLATLEAHGTIVLDRQRLILCEYGNKVRPNRGRAGDKFLKWLLINQRNTKYCEQVTVTPTGENQFAEFPTDPDLEKFDPSDRKFVAVAVAHPETPPIYNAVDSDWAIYQSALERNGLKIEQLCPDCLKES